MACLFLLNMIYIYPLCIFKIFINSKIRKGARKSKIFNGNKVKTKCLKNVIV